MASNNKKKAKAKKAKKAGAREGTNTELVAVLRRLADSLEDPKQEVFVTVSAETFGTDDNQEMTSKSDVSMGGVVPEELDPRLVVFGCIGNLLRTTNESIDLEGVDVKKVMDLLGMGELTMSLNSKPVPKIVEGDFNRG